MIKPIAFALLFSLSTPLAFADNDPNRPTGRIAADLGVSQEHFKKCFMPVNPERNKYPSRKKQRVNKAILLPCLQRANPAITNNKLDTVMDRYRPEGPFRR